MFSGTHLCLCTLSVCVCVFASWGGFQCRGCVSGPSGQFKGSVDINLFSWMATVWQMETTPSYWWSKANRCTVSMDVGVAWVRLCSIPWINEKKKKKSMIAVPPLYIFDKWWQQLAPGSWASKPRPLYQPEDGEWRCADYCTLTPRTIHSSQPPL